MTNDGFHEVPSSKRLLHVIHSVALEGGGPAEGLRRLAETDAMQMEVLCLDDPAMVCVGDHPYPVHALGNSIQDRYGYTPRLVKWFNTNLSRFDGVVIHGLWQYHSFGTYRAVLGKLPYVVFPHGMLDPYFKRAYPLKHLRKAAYWLAFERHVLRDAAAVCFTTEAERECSLGTFPLSRWNPVVVSFGTAAPKGDPEIQRRVFLANHPALHKKRILLFLSRIHKKKGCDILIEAFARIAAAQPNLDLVMAGADRDGLQESLEKQALELGIADRIHWTGMLRDDEKWGAFYAAESFVLPSHQENFGIAVAEALACGVPALISNKVNIWPHVLADGAGIVDDDTADGLHRTLNRFFSLDTAEQLQMGERGKRCFLARYTMDHTARAINQLFG